MEKHKKNCQCYACTHGMDAALKKQQELIKKFGFMVHYVPGDCNYPNHTNIHTHGVWESFNHLDFQMCFPLPMETVTGIFHNIVNQIKEGKVFEPGNKYGKIVDNYLVEFILAIEAGRTVLRLLVPNAQGNYSGMAHGVQLTMTGIAND